jgi:hypothetical protein
MLDDGETTYEEEESETTVLAVDAMPDVAGVVPETVAALEGLELAGSLQAANAPTIENTTARARMLYRMPLSL